MGMTRIYSLETNIHKVACESDNIDEILKWIKDSIGSFPLRTIISIRVREMPTDLWLALPTFKGFEDGSEDIPGSD